MIDQDRRDETILKLARSPRLAHATLFSHRHPQDTPEFHYEIIDLWHSAIAKVLFMAFRGAAKSTLSEEAIIVGACLRKFKNGIIIGESEPRAIERLTAIKHEFETNSFIEELFGPMIGSTWQERKIILTNGVVIQAFGRGQSLRGAKHLSERPDMVFPDDMEDDECVSTPEARAKFKAWFMKVLVPALAPGYRMRISGTPLDPESWLMKLKSAPDWITKVYPIEYKGVMGERKPMWPARFPLELIDTTRKSYEELGAMQDYMQEFMCEATDPATRVFTQEMIKVDPVVRTWEPVYAMFDPARTTHSKSATTGHAVWSWTGRKLIVWDAFGGYWQPDEIVNKIFEVNETYNPIHIGVEQTGLHEFIMQPLRSEQIRRGITIPVIALNAPHQGQIGVIKGLQPFFKAGDVRFAKTLEELTKQMLAFPTGQRDTLNALAYAPRIRPGQPIYDNFKSENVMEDLELQKGQVYLAINATGQWTSAILCQFNNGVLHVHQDWMREGDPGTALADIVGAARLAAIGNAARVVAGPQHFDNYDTTGLRAAAAKIPITVHRGGVATVGRQAIRDLLSKSKHGIPCFAVSTNARWTLNALSGGYCQTVTKQGVLSTEASEGPYRVLIEGLETFASLLNSGMTDDDSGRNYAHTAQGKRYLSALAR